MPHHCDQRTPFAGQDPFCVPVFVPACGTTDDLVPNIERSMIKTSADCVFFQLT